MRPAAIYDLPKTWDIDKIKEQVAKDKPDFGLEKIELQPGSLCQLSCPWCYGKNMFPTLPFGVSIGSYIKNVIKPASPYKPIIIIAGLYSEPTLYVPFTELIEAINKEGLRIGLYTNGIRLTDEMISVLLANPIEGSYISFNYSACTYANIDILPTIRRFVQMRNEKNIDFKVNVPVMLRGNIHNRTSELNELLEAGADFIRYRLPNAPIYPQQEQLAWSEKVYFDTKPFHKCYTMLNSMSVASDGIVYPCSQTSSDCFSDMRLGDVKVENIIDIWKKRWAFWDMFDPSSEPCACNTYENEWNRLCAFLAREEER